jgi:Type III restriction enzyme, res subunit
MNSIKYIEPVLTNEGLEIDIQVLKTKFGEKGYKSILRKFILRYKSPIGTYYIEKKMYDLTKTKLILPRFSSTALIKAGLTKSPKVLLNEGDDFHVEFIGEPTHNQQVIANHVMDNYFSKDKKESGQCGVTIYMLAGGGKTFLSMYLMSLIKKKTLIIVPNTYLLQQWRELLVEFIPEAKVGVYYGKEKVDGDIVVGIVNSLSKEIIVKPSQPLVIKNIKEDKVKGSKMKKVKEVVENIKTSDYCSKFGLVVLDESHMYTTDSFKYIYKNVQSTYMLGLSATPNERDDGSDKISHLNVGEVLDCSKIDNYISDDNTFISDVNIIKYVAPLEYSENRVLESNGMISVPLMLEDLTADPYRNTLIIESIIKMLNFEEGMNVFVFSDRRAHCELLENKLLQRLSEINQDIEFTENVSEEKIEVICTMYGGCSGDLIHTAKNEASVIFTTYAYSSTGVSIDKLNGLVLATPRKSKARQILGRIFRNKKEFLAKKRYVIDICDVNSCFKQQLYGRIPAYKERNSVITYENVSWKDIQNMFV